MTLQLELTYLIGFVVTVIGAFWGMAKMLLSQSQAHIDKQFEAIASTLLKQDDVSRRIERELMDLKAELPRDYVRREDHNRVIGGVHLSLDNLRLTIERFMLDRGKQP